MQFPHWTTLNKPPASRHVRQAIRDELLRKKKGRVDDVLTFLADFVRGYRALDIGVAEHNADRAARDTFKFKIVTESAAYALGLDILDEDVRKLVARGFNVRRMDATSDQFLGETFDRVVLGDVIEHVDRPVEMLRFARRHLVPGGRVLCVTPNPFFVLHVYESLRKGVFVANAEHVSWVTASMALELGHRSGLELVEYWHAQGEGKTLLRWIGVRALALMGLRNSELFTGAFLYVFEKTGAAVESGLEDG